MDYSTEDQYQFLTVLHRKLDRLKDLCGNAKPIMGEKSEQYEQYEQSVEAFKSDVQEAMQELDSVIHNESAATQTFLSNKSRIKPVYSKTQQTELKEQILKNVNELLEILEESDEYDLDFSEQESQLQEMSESILMD